jgi:tRNA A-37 threonylcarbamoyl transferase component Bud32
VTLEQIQAGGPPRSALDEPLRAIIHHFSPDSSTTEDHRGILDLQVLLDRRAALTEIDTKLRGLSRDGYLRGALVTVAAHLRAAPRDDLALRVAAELCDALAPELGMSLARAVLSRPRPVAESTARDGALAGANALLADALADAGDYPGALRHWDAVLAVDIDHRRALSGHRRAVEALERRGRTVPRGSRGLAVLAGLDSLQLEGPGLERYELGRPLGRGRHAVVYQAWDREVGREVAIKRLLPRGARGDDVPDRVVDRLFFVEARTLSRVRSPHVVALLDVQPDHRFVALELCRGGNLRQALRRGRIDASQLARVAKELRRALDAVHAAGAVHRDVKPANLLLRTTQPDAPLALADFGLAMPGPAGGTAPEQGRAGTLRYMAPEVRRGGPATTEADRFSAGVLLLELALHPEPLPRVLDQLDDLQAPSSAIPEGLDAPATALLRRLLSATPEERQW